MPRARPPRSTSGKVAGPPLPFRMLLAAGLLLAVVACDNVVARGHGDSDGVEDAEVGITF